MVIVFVPKTWNGGTIRTSKWPNSLTPWQLFNGWVNPITTIPIPGMILGDQGRKVSQEEKLADFL